MYFFLATWLWLISVILLSLHPKCWGVSCTNKMLSLSMDAAQLGCFGSHDCRVFATSSIWPMTGMWPPVTLSPLYMVVMSPGYAQLVAVPYGYSFPVALFHAILTFHLSYCHSNIINHFYCDDMPLLRLTRSDTHSKQLWIFACAVSCSSFLLIVFVSGTLSSAILKMRSTAGRRKAFYL